MSADRAWRHHELVFGVHRPPLQVGLRWPGERAKQVALSKIGMPPAQYFEEAGREACATKPRVFRLALET
jgi:hypothetical protein